MVSRRSYFIHVSVNYSGFLNRPGRDLGHKTGRRFTYLLHNKLKRSAGRQVESREREFSSRETPSQWAGVEALRCWDLIVKLSGPHGMRDAGLRFSGGGQLRISPDDRAVTIELGPVLLARV